MSHRSRSTRWLAALVLLSPCSLLLFGQDNAQQNQTNQQRTVTHPLQVNVTGCLKRSSQTGGYYVADQNGRTWELTSKKVDLAKHMSHVVSVSGHPSAGPQTPEGKSEPGQTPEGGTQHFALDVTELEMVSNS